MIFDKQGNSMDHFAYPFSEKRPRVLIHHLNPITEQDVLSESSVLFDPENLICVSHETNNAIYYGVGLQEENDILKQRCSYYATPELCRLCNFKCPYRKK